MKKFLLLILVLALTLSTFVACGEPKDETPEVTTDAKTEGTTEKVEGTSEDTTDEVTTDELIPEPTALEEAMAYVHQLYKDNIAQTVANYDLVKSVTIGDESFSVVWTIEGTDKVTIVDKDDIYVTVVVPEQGDADIPYTIKATITSGEETVTREYERVVPKFAVNTHEEYMAAKQDDVLTIQGIVVAMNAKSAGNTRNHLFLADETVKGGYYIYQMEADPIESGIQVGMTVTVTGPASPYSGMMEIKGGQAKIVDTTIKTVDVLDITEKFAAGENLAKFVGLPVTIKGVTITDQELGGTSDYLNFELNGAKAYVRTYKTDFPTTLQASDKDTIDAFHAANRGNTADATGILVLYSGAPYLIPMSVDCFTNVQQPERNDAEKAEFELSTITVAGKLTSDTVLTLPVVGGVYDNVTITWASNSEYAVVDGATVTITIPDAATEITLTATAVCGSETKTAEFTIKLSKTLTSVSDAIAMGAGKEHNTYTDDKYLVGGIITEVYNETYGNMKITDENGNILTIYGTYSADGADRYDAMATKPVAGDYIVVLGIIGQYNGTPQVKNGWIVTHKTTTSIEDANTLGGTFEKNNYTEDKYLVTGTVKEIQNATYGNIVIEDANGNSILVYGTYDSTGANRFDAMTTQPKVGDIVTVYGIVGYYSAPQLKNAWIVNIVAGEEPEPAPEISDLTGNGMASPDQYRENGNVVVNDGQANVWILNNRANGITGVDNISFRGWVFLGDGINVEIADFGYMLGIGTDIVWGSAPIVDEAIFAPLEGRTATRRYDITIDLTSLAAGEYDVFLYVKDADGNIYKIDIWAEVWVKVEAPAAPADPTPDSTLTITEVIALGSSKEHNVYTEGKYYVTGVITEVYNTQYGNMKITDADGNILTIYGTYDATGENRYDVMTTQPVAGDTVTIYGIVGQYNGTPQVKNGWITAHTPAVTPDPDPDPDPDPTPSTEIVFDFGDNGDAAHFDGTELTADKTYTSGSYELVLTNVSKVYDGALDAKGNSCLKLGTSKAIGTFTFTVPADINSVIIYAARYKSYADNNVIIVNGTTHTLSGASNDGQYDAIVIDTSATKTIVVETTTSGAKPRAMINSIVFSTAAGGSTPTPDPEPTPDADPTPDTTLTIVEVLALGSSKEHNIYTTGKYYVTGVITEVYNTTYGNMKITDDAGNILTIYGTYSADGSARYDAMTSKPVAGDTVTIYGVVGQYNGTPQIKNGWITEFTHEHNYADATCTAPKTCACGATDGEANGHNYVDGACTTCGAACPHTDVAAGETCGVCGVTVPAEEGGDVEVTVATATLTPNTTENINSFASGDDITSYTSLAGSEVFTLTVGDKTNNSNQVYISTSGEIRLYSDNSDYLGNTLTINSTKKIVSIAITYSGTSRSGATFTIGDTTVAGGTNITEETITVNANSVTIANNKTSGQLRITSIVITYEA